MTIIEPREHFFSTIVGHDLQKQLIRKMWELGQFPQTILFAGAPRIGKRSLAYALSKLIVCDENKAGTSMCGCRSCSLIARGIHPDIFTVEPRGATNTIQVDQLREIQDIANSAPIEARRKIIIFVDADRMNPSAANSALKLLEEPPSYTLLILLATRPHQMLPTVKSRCMKIALNPATEGEIDQWLREKLDVSDVTARLAATFSAGIPGLALEIARCNYLGRRDLLLREIDFMLNNGFPALFSVADELSKRFEQREIIEMLLSWIRDILVAKYENDPSHLIINKDALDDILRLREQYAEYNLYRVLNELFTISPLTQRIVNKRLLLFVMLLRLGKLLKQP